jgi:hygromycin-B 7''-O-kinase
MSFTPPSGSDHLPLRARLPEAGWREAALEIAGRHGLDTRVLQPFERGETIVWRVGEHVVKLTHPDCAFQIAAELACLGALHGRLSVSVPAVHAHGELAGWPYVVMTRIGGRPLCEVWPALAYAERLRLAGELGALARELHAQPVTGFPEGWQAFWSACRGGAVERHAASGAPASLIAQLHAFLARCGPLADGAHVPLHTELIDQHVYVTERAGRCELSGLLDFADARSGPAEYDFSAPVAFVFRGERGLLRAFLLAYGVPESQLTPHYAQRLLAWALCHRFGNLARELALLHPPRPETFEELAERLYALGE